VLLDRKSPPLQNQGCGTRKFIGVGGQIENSETRLKLCYGCPRESHSRIPQQAPFAEIRSGPAGIPDDLSLKRETTGKGEVVRKFG